MEINEFFCKRRPLQEWCAFYTPQGRMVSKPAGRRPRHMHPEDWCADKTPFKGKVIRELLMLKLNNELFPTEAKK